MLKRKLLHCGKKRGRGFLGQVDTYNVFTNNCITTSVEGVQSGSKQDLKLDGLKGPMAVRDVLNVQSGKKESNVIKIPSGEIKKKLKLSNE
jgi:ribosomal protein L6P/L9E